ncbi:hypothetical protein ORF40 [Halorubrum tailed virus]|nr:hypothetical protein ORF40 [Halorubrum tailed virus]
MVLLKHLDLFGQLFSNPTSNSGDRLVALRVVDISCPRDPILFCVCDKPARLRHAGGFCVTHIGSLYPDHQID